MATYKIIYDYLQKGDLYAVTYRLLVTTYCYIQVTYGYIQITYRSHTAYVMGFLMSAMGYMSTLRITYRLHREDRLPRYVLYVAYVVVCSNICPMNPP